jgi:hypothetical protein
MRFGVFAAACLFIAAPVIAADDGDNGSFVVAEDANSVVPRRAMAFGWASTVLFRAQRHSHHGWGQRFGPSSLRALA